MLCSIGVGGTIVDDKEGLAHKDADTLDED